MLAILSNLSMFVVMGFLLCGAIIVPHDQKLWAKVLLIGLAAFVGWRSTTLHGAPCELTDIAVAALLLARRRHVWRCMLKWLSRSEPRKASRSRIINAFLP